MGLITDKAMQAAVDKTDQWLTEDGPRGSGRFLGRITRSGERAFYFRHTVAAGQRNTLLIGPYDPKGREGLTVAQARAQAGDWTRLYLSGVHQLRSHFAQLDEDKKQAQADARLEAARARRAAGEAEQQATLERQRRLTVRQLFDRWAATELAPHTRADGKRTGRKDGGQYSREQFERRIFPAIGEMPIAEVRKSDVLTILDAVKSEGKLRTANVLLADLKQMMRFAVMRDAISHSPLESVTKRDAGGTEAGRERVLSTQDIASLAKDLPAARLNKRSQLAIWLVLATGCRIGELMGAEWPHVDLGAATWHLPETKNQRPHTIHLSEFALQQFRALDELRVLDPATKKPVPWVFPNTAGTGPVCIKSFGKQLADRQRPADRRMQHRSKATEALTLPGGKWTAHDLRRTAATLMAGLGVSGDVIDECLNHVIESRVRRTYIRDRRPQEQARAFDALGAKLGVLVLGDEESSNVVPMRGLAA